MGHALSALLTLLASAPSVEVAPASPVELDRLGAISSPAQALGRQAEEALARGDLSDAAALYQQARETAPQSGFAARRQCELLTALGRREPALAACQLALQYGAAEVYLRAGVGALMSGPGRPVLDDVVEAATLAAGAQRLLPGQPHSYAAFADIARRIGDPIMMRTNLDQLQRLAPDHFETRRAQRLVPPSHRGWRWLGWAALALATLAGLFRLRRPLRAVSPVALALLLAGRAQAQPEPLSDIPIDEHDPSSQVPTPSQAAANPIQFAYLLMDLATRADEAEKQGQYAQAIKYYQALAQAAPDRSVSFGKMCRNHEQLGNRQAGLDACRDALGRQGVRVEDYQRYVRLLLDHPGPVTLVERTDVLEIASHLRKDAATREGADDVQCQLAARISDLPLLEDCVGRLHGNEPRALSYRWALALERRNFSEAHALVDQARAAGLPDPLLSRMDTLTRTQERRRRLPLWGGAALGLMGLALFFRKGRRTT